MQGAEERRLRRTSDTPQGGAIEGNAADDALVVDQGYRFSIDTQGGTYLYSLSEKSCSDKKVPS